MIGVPLPRNRVGSFRRWSFRVRVPLLISAVSLATALAISLTIGWAVRGWLVENLHIHVLSVSQSLGRNLVAQIARDDVWEAFQAVEAVTSAEGAAYHGNIVVLDREQKVFVSSDPLTFPPGTDVSALSSPYRRAASLQVASSAAALSDEEIDDEEATLVKVPLVSSDAAPLGTLLMHYSHRPFARRYAEAMERVALIGMGFVALLVPLGWWLGHRLAAPISQATESLQRLTQDAALRSRDYAGDTMTAAAELRSPPAAAELPQLQHSVMVLERQLRELEDLRERFAAAERQKGQAEMASRAKSAFLGSMSHELRTPLNALLGYVQILQLDRDLGERRQRYLRTIRESGLHLQRLIEDMLDLARIEAGKLQLLPAEVDLGALFELIVDSMRATAEGKGLELVYEVEGRLPPGCTADPKRLQQVVWNLLSNAVKFTDQGSVRLKVRCREAGGRAWVYVEVADTGVGLSPEDASRIFQPFEQAGDGAKRSQGVGLGLAITRELLELMGSTIALDSQVGRGSRFWFELDLPLLQRQTAPRAAPPADVAGYLGPRRTVLIADDVDDNRALLDELLSPLGFVICHVENGEALLASARLAPPDLIITDIVMAPMDGLEAVRRLRTTPQLAGVPVIALSAAVSEGTRAQSLAAGANCFLGKPVEVSRLLEEMSALLELRWVPKKAATAGAEPPAGRSSSIP